MLLTVGTVIACWNIFKPFRTHLANFKLAYESKSTVFIQDNETAIQPQKAQKNMGYVVKMIGPALEVAFPSGKIPKQRNAILIETKNGQGVPISIKCEVLSLIEDTNRVVAMASSYRHLKVGMKAIDTEIAFIDKEEEKVPQEEESFVEEEPDSKLILTLVVGKPQYFGYRREYIFIYEDYGNFPGGESYIIYYLILSYCVL